MARSNSYVPYVCVKRRAGQTPAPVARILGSFFLQEAVIYQELPFAEPKHKMQQISECGGLFQRLAENPQPDPCYNRSFTSKLCGVKPRATGAEILFATEAENKKGITLIECYNIVPAPAMRLLVRFPYI